MQCVSDAEHRASLRKLGLRRSKDFRWRPAAEATLEIYRQAIAGVAPGDTAP